MEQANTKVGPESTDETLLAAVRLGDAEAFGHLYVRYQNMARAIARKHTQDITRADDIVSEAFARILQALKNGNGPKEYMGGYISTTIAHLAAEYGIISAREVPSEAEHLEAMGSLDETVLKLHDADEVVSAFTNLPERWQTVLWMTEVEERRPREVATALNMTPNAVSALAVRARESLREGFLRAHQNAPQTNECGRFTSHISPYVRGSLSQKRSDALRVHMETCTYCTSEYLSLASINKSMRTWIFPVLAGLGVLVTDSSKLLALIGGFSGTGIAAVELPKLGAHSVGVPPTEPTVYEGASAGVAPEYDAASSQTEIFSQTSVPAADPVPMDTVSAGASNPSKTLDDGVVVSDSTNSAESHVSAEKLLNEQSNVQVSADSVAFADPLAPVNPSTSMTGAEDIPNLTGIVEPASSLNNAGIFPDVVASSNVAASNDISSATSVAVSGSETLAGLAPAAAAGTAATSSSAATTGSSTSFSGLSDSSAGAAFGINSSGGTWAPSASISPAAVAAKTTMAHGSADAVSSGLAWLSPLNWPKSTQFVAVAATATVAASAAGMVIYSAAQNRTQTPEESPEVPVSGVVAGPASDQHETATSDQQGVPDSSVDSAGTKSDNARPDNTGVVGDPAASSSATAVNVTADNGAAGFPLALAPLVEEALKQRQKDAVSIADSVNSQDGSNFVFAAEQVLRNFQPRHLGNSSVIDPAAGRHLADSVNAGGQDGRGHDNQQDGGPVDGSAPLPSVNQGPQANDAVSNDSKPTADPTPDAKPSVASSTEPVVAPDETAEPTVAPTMEPTTNPTTAPIAEPTADPTVAPSGEPTADPTVEPSTDPTVEPTADPTAEPTVEPTAEPSAEPTADSTVTPDPRPTATWVPIIEEDPINSEPVPTSTSGSTWVDPVTPSEPVSPTATWVPNIDEEPVTEPTTGGSEWVDTGEPTPDPNDNPSPLPSDQEDWPTIVIWDAEGNPIEIPLLPAFKETADYWIETEDYLNWRAAIPFNVIDWRYVGNQQCIVKYEKDGVRMSAIHWLPVEMLNSTYTNYEVMTYFGYDAVFRVEDCIIDSYY